MKPTAAYKKMCLEAKEIQEKWIPKVGDYFNLDSSYCCNEDQCTEKNPCLDCLKMSNVFILAGDHCDKVFFFEPMLCNRDGGILLNETKASVFVPNRAESKESVKRIHTYMPTNQEEVTWIPRQDQYQEMLKYSIQTISENDSKMLNLMDYFVYYWHLFPEDQFDCLEAYWLSLVMEQMYHKKWNQKLNIWEKEKIHN